jgi:hypothetical protein
VIASGDLIYQMSQLGMISTLIGCRRYLACITSIACCVSQSAAGNLVQFGKLARNRRTVETLKEFERLCLDNITEVFFGNGKPVTPVNHPEVDSREK